MNGQEHQPPTLGVGDAVKKADAVASSAALRLARDGSEANNHAPSMPQ